MKKLISVALCVLILSTALVGCSNSGGTRAPAESGLEKDLVGAWYFEDAEDFAFILYEDGSCDIAGEFGKGRWFIQNEDQLVLSLGGESETATVVSVGDGKLVITNGSNNRTLYSTPQS